MDIALLSRTKQSILAAALGLCAALAAIVYFFFLPSLGAFKSLTKQIGEKKTELSAIKAQPEEYSGWEEKAEKTGQQIEAVKKRIFWESDVSRFLAEVTRFASDLKIDFVSLNPKFAAGTEKEKKTGQDYSLTEQPILIIIKSTYDDLVKFLERIEQADKFISVQSLNIETDAQDVYRHTIRMELSIYTNASLN